MNVQKVIMKIDEAVDIDWIVKEIPNDDYWSEIEKGLEQWLKTYNVSLKNGDSLLVGKTCFYPYKLKDCVDIDFIIQYHRQKNGLIVWKRIVSAYWEYDDPVVRHKYDIQNQLF
jgi:hypothetical protein